MLVAAWGRSTLCLALVIACSDPVPAAELSLELGVESFYWREYEAGARLLEERGPRFRLGGSWRQPLGMHDRDNLLLRGALYFGEVDYDGQACDFSNNCFPFQTDARYGGALVEATVTRSLSRSSNGEVFAGGGVDTWRRDIQGRDGVSGAIEDWTVFYLVTGAGGRWTRSEVRYQAHAGIKYPFYTHETADLFDVVLRPKGRLSFFARLAADFASVGRPRWGLGLYYDSYRFDRSDMEQVTATLLVWQPESWQDTIGVYAIVYLP